MDAQELTDLSWVIVSFVEAIASLTSLARARGTLILAIATFLESREVMSARPGTKETMVKNPQILITCRDPGGSGSSNAGLEWRDLLGSGSAEPAQTARSSQDTKNISSPVRVFDDWFLRWGLLGDVPFQLSIIGT